ncbi:MAG: tetratricopeptide repeat protein, partial [Nitrospira sp.]|nr:tetratricopeptide repeat protein [Nitrospira sp.]
MNIYNAIRSAIEHYHAGDFNQAESVCKNILRKQPSNLTALHLLGITYYHLGKYDFALQYLSEALRFDPNSYEGFYNLGRAFQKKGDNKKATDCYHKSIRLNPTFVDAYINLGNILRDEGRPDEAIICYKKIIESNPNNSGLYFNLGVAFQDKEQFDEAITCYQKALALNLKVFGIYNNLGLAFQNKEEIEEAISCFQKSLKLNPCFAEAYFNLGNVHNSQGQIDEAISYYQKAIQYNPNYLDAYNNLGIVFKDKGQYDQAISCYQKVIQLNPLKANAYNNLGNVFKVIGRTDIAFIHYKKALELNPHDAGSYNNLGNVFKDAGKVNEAEEYYRKALQLTPDSFSYFSNLLLALNYTSYHDAQTVFSEHLRFAEQLAEPLASDLAPHTNDPSPSRRLKIGYVSPDFRRHSVNYFIEPVLALHSHEQFEVFCYSDVFIPDNVTQRLQNYTDHWQSIVGMSDKKVAELIRKDGIDILIDLAGHTGYNRMLLFARKPAPIQASWLGYPNTTGLSTIDYRIVDNYTDALGLTDHFYTEKLIRLPGSFICYMPDSDSPGVSEQPFLSSGVITFGSFNYFPKLSSETIAIWTKILQAIPGSRLIMKARSFSDTTTCQYATELFRGFGVAVERIDLLSHVPSFREHLDLYNKIDIGLDTFPYNGTTTTCEALWMGVPVITLAGNTHASRVGMSLLSN